MSALLNKRLARSLWRTKLRLLAVVLMVFVGVFAGITFGGYAYNLGGMYDTMQADINTKWGDLNDLHDSRRKDMRIANRETLEAQVKEKLERDALDKLLSDQQSQQHR